MIRDDILQHLNSNRRSEEADPLHKWIGTYNLRRVYLMRFFKWLYNPEIEQSKRPIPDVVKNIRTFKRKEQSIYKPTDLWTEQDDALFLKYCPNKRDRCYHMVAYDSSCRPDEILGLKIRSIVFKSAGEHQYAEVLVGRKTGTRPIPLIDSIPYIKDWLDSHPQRGNPNAYFIPSMDRKHKRFGNNKMNSMSINTIYRNYKLDFFPALLEDPKVPPEDKQKIRELLQKPWNPYVFRHSALTQKSTVLKEHILRQHAGWSGRSQMHLKYLHYFGNESSESLLEAYGIDPKDHQLVDMLRPKPCPNCSEPNKPDSKFCAKCRMVLTYDAYNETLEKQQEKQSEIQKLQEKYEQDMKVMREEMQKLILEADQSDQIKIMREQIAQLQERHSNLIKWIDGYAREARYLHSKYPQIIPREQDLKKWEEEHITYLSEEDLKELKEEEEEQSRAIRRTFTNKGEGLA